MSETQPKDDIIDVEPQVISEVKATAPKTKSWLRFLPPVLFGALCALGGGWFYRDLLAGYFPSDRLQTLNTRVTAIETTTKDSQKRVDAVVALTEELKAKLSAAQAAADKSAKLTADAASVVQGNTSDLTAMKQDLEKLSTTTADVQAKLAAGAGAASGAVDPTITTRLAQLEKQVSAAPMASSDVPDLTSNLKTLRSLIAQGQNYSTALAPMARALPAAPGLDVLGNERAGLANAAALAAELDSLRVNLPKPPLQAEDSGVWAGFKSVFSKLVRVRGQGGEDWATLAAKASAFAAAGDLDQASATITKAGTEPPAPLKTWADKAQRRLNLDKSLNTFSAALTRAGLAKE